MATGGGSGLTDAADGVARTDNVLFLGEDVTFKGEFEVSVDGLVFLALEDEGQDNRPAGAEKLAGKGVVRLKVDDRPFDDGIGHSHRCPVPADGRVDPALAVETWMELILPPIVTSVVNGIETSHFEFFTSGAGRPNGR